MVPMQGFWNFVSFKRAQIKASCISLSKKLQRKILVLSGNFSSMTKHHSQESTTSRNRAKGIKNIEVAVFRPAEDTNENNKNDDGGSS